MDLVSMLKKDATSLIFIEKGEGSLEKTKGNSSPKDTKGKVMAPIKPTTTLSWMAQATQVALAMIGKPSLFDPLCLFIAHLKVEYGGF